MENHVLKMRNLAISSQTVFYFDANDDVVFDLDDESPISYKNGLISKHHGNDDETVIVSLLNVFAQEETSLNDERCSGLCWLSDGRIVISFLSGLLISYDTGGIENSEPEVVGSFPTGLQVCSIYFAIIHVICSYLLPVMPELGGPGGYIRFDQIVLTYVVYFKEVHPRTFILF